MLDQIRRLFRRWLHEDRIRIPSTQGQWLRLEVGQQVIMQGNLCVVQTREVMPKGSTVLIHYRLSVCRSILDQNFTLPGTPLWLDGEPHFTDESCEVTFILDDCCEND